MYTDRATSVVKTQMAMVIPISIADGEVATVVQHLMVLVFALFIVNSLQKHLRSLAQTAGCDCSSSTIKMYYRLLSTVVVYVAAIR